MSSDKRDVRSYAVIGAAMEVHRVLGAGFLESVYRQALALEFCARGVVFEKEVTLPVRYKGADVGVFRADFLCFDAMIVEVKGIGKLHDFDVAQVINYLKAAKKDVV